MQPNDIADTAFLVKFAAMIIQVKDLAELPKAATRLLEIGQGRRVFLFYGDMGVGKTTFIKEICGALGVAEATSSPTFSIVNEYQSTSGTIYHFDFYRLKSEQEAFDMGYEEYFYSGRYCLVEWPERIAGLLPDDAVIIRMEALPDDSRQVSIAL